MTMFSRMAVAVVVVALVIAMQPTCVFACSCLPPGPPEDALADAAAVFSGRVTAVSAPADAGGSMPVQVTFAVARSWKGVDRPAIVVNTPASSASCGVNFEKGQEYLVYALRSEGRLETNLCSRTTQLGAAGADLAVLGAGSPPGGAGMTPTLPAAGGDALSADQSLAMFAAGALLIVFGAGMLKRRRV